MDSLAYLHPSFVSLPPVSVASLPVAIVDNSILLLGSTEYAGTGLVGDAVRWHVGHGADGGTEERHPYEAMLCSTRGHLLRFVP